MLTQISRLSLLVVLPMLLLSACTSREERAKRDLNKKGKEYSEQAFVEAAKSGDADTVKLFLAAGMKPNATNNDGRPALVEAALADREAVVDELLDAGADVNAKTKEGQTALMGAAVNGNPRIANILLARGADANVKDTHGFTALMYADGAGKSQVRDILVKAGVQDWHPGPLQTPATPIPLAKKK